MKHARTILQALFLPCVLLCVASCVSAPMRSVPAPLAPAPLAIERMSDQPLVRVTVELPASEDPASWDRKGAEELAKALHQTGQFEVATVVSLSPSAFAALPPQSVLAGCSS